MTVDLLVVSGHPNGAPFGHHPYGNLNHDGIYKDASAVVTDVNHDGRTDGRDLRAMGVAGDIHTVRFYLNGPLF